MAEDTSVVLPLKIGTDEWLEELPPGTGNVLAQVWRVQFLVNQTRWSFKWAAVLGHRTLEEGFEDRYGYSIFEFAASDESESEDEGGHEPILWKPSNM